MNFPSITVGLFSPSDKVYSETFIRAHKEKLPFTIKHFYKGYLPILIDGEKIMPTRFKRGLLLLLKRTKYRDLSLQELALFYSLKKYKINVALAEYGPTGTAITKVCERLSIPLLVHFHGFDASVESVIKGNVSYKEIFSYAKHIFVVSRTMQGKLLELGCPEKKLIYNVYGPNEVFFEVKPNFSSQKFIAVGRFVNKKAPYYTILAFHKVVCKFPKAQLVLGGTGELWEACTNLVKYLRLENNVLLPGVIDQENYRAHLTDSLAFVQHSITAHNGDMEGTPVAILEANAAGVPVISTRHAGIPDVIVHEETGFLVDEHEVDAMADYMILFIEQPQLAKKMGEAGRKRILQFYTMEKHIDVIAEKIKESIS